MAIGNKGGSALLCAALLAAALCGCSNEAALRSAVERDARAVNELQREVNALIAARKPPAEVHVKVSEADLRLDSLRKACAEVTKEKPGRVHRFLYFFVDSNMVPRGLAASCGFYAELTEKIAASMAFQSGKYHAGMGNREKAEQILAAMPARFPEEFCGTEVDNARKLLADFKEWGSFTTGWRAYILGDYATAIKEFKADGDPRFLFKIGDMYRGGDGVPQDLKKAAESYLKAAERGYARAQYQIATFYADGTGVKKDPATALEWMKKAADKGYQPAKEALNLLLAPPR